MSREELKEELEKYKGILNKTKVEYLNSLIELEFSIINNFINDDDRQVLSELDIYSEIANYNITNRALNLIEQKNDIDTVIKNNDEELRIYAEINKSCFLLFSYDLIGIDKYEEDIGRISLFQTINSVEQNEKEIKRIERILDNLYNEKNPFININDKKTSDWILKRSNDIKMYETKLGKIQNKTSLTDTEKKEIEILNIIHDLFLNDYGLTNNSFVPDQYVKKEQTELYKTYIKQIPKINIKNNIKYI